ncbi:GNAT family N-acetyltransferase [Longispora albida]|uniref:GNAT family N-acetyltransferase n=1 Tax=Longispora albida TaxID=203523 RepID=UPI00035CE3B6|nr:GNAT family N-acetyltransferase [Longispora albida]
MTTLIRPATPNDGPAIGQLKARAWRAAYSSFMPAAYLDGIDPVREGEAWGEYLAEIPAGHRMWIAEVDGAVAGFCRTGPAESDPDLGTGAGEVYGLYVEPALIGTGLGRLLFGHGVSDLRERGHEPVCVYAYAPNETAIRFYERAGFAADGVTKTDEGDGTGVAEVRLVARR